MGLEKTFYQVSEDVGVVEVCAIVYEPNRNLACPISFPFNVSLSTGDDSAGIPTALLYVYMMTAILHSTVDPMDYIGVSTILVFEGCDRQHCVYVTIVDDDILEMPELFTVTLERTPGLDDRITLDPVDGVFEINTTSSTTSDRTTSSPQSLSTTSSTMGTTDSTTSSSPQSSSDNTAAIIGGVVAIVFIIAIVIVIAIIGIITFKLRSHGGIKKAEE